MASNDDERWQGIRGSARTRLETRDYTKDTLARRLADGGIGAGELIDGREELDDAWIPGVEVFSRRVFQQKGRGYFSELTRVERGRAGPDRAVAEAMGFRPDAPRQREGIPHPSAACSRGSPGGTMVPRALMRTLAATFRAGPTTASNGTSCFSSPDSAR